MGTIKTLVTNESVDAFIDTIDSDSKRHDSLTLLQMYTRLTGEPAKMWGPTMIGFGMYHYKSTHSSQEGDWPLAAFSPRKQSLTLYIMPGFNDYSDLLSELGKHKTSVGCLYINKLSDINTVVLEKIIKRSYIDAKAQNS